ncbi:hypothetical protein Q8F55_001146 [Vanrija albida]|uniref:N-acetyltransferase domain-containing protein n=1 Tax=Vanrija albida TaxID=181172 RepID=A0ABR3QF92_9TREE
MSHGHGIPKHRQLPDKEAKLFKELLTYYELKQYKKGLKAADTILKKLPNHGETIALKALTLHSSLPFPATAASQPKAEEAEEMARTAVRKDITSHITWHVLGILAKTRRDWTEASKAFVMARKQDPDNIPVLRDAIALSTHTRNYRQALEARHHYLLLRPQIRSSWLGLMVSHELVGDYDEAIRVYDSLQDTLKKDGATAPEQAQTLLHVIKVTIQAGKFQDAKDRLDKGLRDGVISPRGEASEIKAHLLVELGRQDEAEDAYRALLEQNPDNLAYYGGFLRNRGLDISQKLDDEAIAKVLKSLDAFSETYPRSTAPRRLALDVATGDEFSKRAREYLVRGLERGVPSLFVDVKGVYGDQAKLAAVGEIIADIVDKVKADASLHGDDTVPPPTTLLWAHYFQALHLAHPLNPNPDHARALQLLDVALEHTPTLPEIYMAKALVYKRAGDVQLAAETMEEARSLDGQDRFLNGKAGKYWLRAGHIQKAEELLALFTKKDVGAVQDLTDMQSLWFLQEEGDAHKRNGKLGFALKRYQSLVTVFQEYEDDQYDFHSYCMRRMTLNAYISLLQYEDQLRTHPAFFNTALSAIDIYVKIADDPSLTVEKLTPEQEAERKKAAKKAQKAEQKAKKAAAAVGDGKKEDAPVPDPDPRGDVLLQTETPIADALKLWAPLEKHHAGRVETWLAGYELHVRQKQYALALRDLREAAVIDKAAAGLLPALVHFRQTVAAAKDVAEPVRAAIAEVLPTLVSDKTAAELVAASLATHPSSPAHILAAGKALQLAGAPASEVRNVLSGLAAAGTPPSVPTMQAAVALLGASTPEGDALRADFRKRLPLAWAFATADEKDARAKATAAAAEPAAGAVKADV